MAIRAEPRIRGLREFRRELKAMDSRWGPALRRTFLEVANRVAGAADAAAPSRVKGSIRGRGTQRGAFVDVVARRGDEIAVVMGAKGRFGWYAAPRYSGSSGRQFAPWVGNQWVPGETGGKPYFIGDPINREVEPALETLADGIEDLARRAFPD